MKQNLILLMTFVAAVAFASCNPVDNGVDKPVADKTLKTISLTIANSTTRAVVDAPTVGDQEAVIEASKLQIIFLDGNGNIATKTDGEAEVLQAFKLSTGERPDADKNEPEEEEEEVSYTEDGTYIFHNLPAEVESAFITNISNYTAVMADDAIVNKVAAMEANTNSTAAIEAMNVAGAEIVVWGAGDFSDEPIGEDDHNGVYTKIYSCSINVAPKIAKIEIVNIELELPGEESEDPVKFTAFDPIKIGLHGIAGFDFSYPAPREGDVDGEGDPIEDWETIAAAGLAAWEEAAGWNTDLFDEEETYFGEEGKIFSYVVPASTPAIGDAEAINVPAPDIIVEGNGTSGIEDFVLSNPYYIRTEGFTGTGANALQPGVVYQVELVFKNENIRPWIESKLKCVEVNVTIKKWEVETLTPIFD